MIRINGFISRPQQPGSLLLARRLVRFIPNRVLRFKTVTGLKLDVRFPLNVIM